MGILTRLCGSTVKHVYADECPQFRVEPLLMIAGCVGVGGHKLSRLLTLDLGRAPVEDAGLLGLAKGCRKIMYLNLCECTEITDVGVTAVALSMNRLRVVNLQSCANISNRSMEALAANCPDLTSLNVANCLKIGNKGLKAIGNGCVKLQALNLAGLKKISEMGLYWLGEKCKGLLMLNVTGCDEITVNGFNALIEGLHYVEAASTFTGFKPIDNHVNRKLEGQLEMIQEHNERLVREKEEAEYRARKLKEKQLLDLQNKASSTIALCIRRYKCRLYFYWIHMRKKRHAKYVDVVHIFSLLGINLVLLLFCSAITIQRLIRGARARIVAKLERIRRDDLALLEPHIVVLQAVARGRRSRRANPYIREVLFSLYEKRNFEAEVGTAVRFQAYVRKFLAVKRRRVVKEFWGRRHYDETSSALLIQRVVMNWLRHRRFLQNKRHATATAVAKAAATKKIGKFIRQTINRIRGRIARAEVLRQWQIRLEKTSLLQRFVRGHWGRKRAHKQRIYEATRYHAAMTIQRMYRGKSVMHWRDMRLNVVVAFVLDRQYVERRARIADSRRRYVAFIDDVRRDSASQSEDEGDDPSSWIAQYDPIAKREYWVNDVTHDVTFEEPRDIKSEKMQLFGMRVKVFWIAQDFWFEGTIANYHKRKNRFRINYDDGDHEWMDIYKEQDRIQIQKPDGSYVILSQYRTAAETDEKNKVDSKRAEAARKAQARMDAFQWKVLSSADESKILFLSEATGEIRVGKVDALYWDIQEDDYGYPIFVNSITGVVEYEDPRFNLNFVEELAAQRAFVMQELRYAVYFCRNLLDEYYSARDKGDEKKKRVVIKKIIDSSKPKQLTAFLMRAKALYKQTSVVDKPIEAIVVQELEYASWMTTELSRLMNEGEDLRRRDQKGKIGALDKLLSTQAKEKFVRVEKSLDDDASSTAPTSAQNTARGVKWSESMIS